MFRRLILTLCLSLAFPASAGTVLAQSSADSEIRTALETWTEDFNAGRVDRTCDLFARDLIAQYRGAPERGHERQCQLLTKALTDRARRYHNALAIREILVFGDIAVARVVWTQTVREIETGKETKTVEPGLDVFRRDADGRWRIIRYLAYDEE
ncbi:YybH family protein [Pseudorhodoplanes sp.]|uniref:YybH family protein n=1 Tax=Pseudorhodoplanes sp. TaxID=1934341 RepID=UPI003D0B898F